MAPTKTSNPRKKGPSIGGFGVAKKQRVTKSKRAGVLFPVGRVRNQMKAGRYAKIIGNGGAVYMAAVLEYLAAEVLDMSGHVARQNNRHRINPRHINLAVRNDSQMDKLLKDVTIMQGGVVPYIHSVLLQKKTKPRKSSSSSSSYKQSEDFTPTSQHVEENEEEPSAYQRSEDFTSSKTGSTSQDVEDIEDNDDD